MIKLTSCWVYKKKCYTKKYLSYTTSVTTYAKSRHSSLYSANINNVKCLREDMWHVMWKQPKSRTFT